MKQPKVLLTGSSGFVGTRFQQLLNERVDIIPFTGDICDRETITAAIKDSHCDVVVHLASKTHIDLCEDDRKNGRNGSVWKTNVDGTAHVAAACQRYKTYLLLLSTECVFDGQKGNYLETDRPHPINWYGETKWRSEQIMKESGATGCVLRAVLAYGHCLPFPHDLAGQIIGKLQNNIPFPVVSDQTMNPTFIDDLIAVIAGGIRQRPVGIFHYGGTDAVSPYTMARMLAKRMRKNDSLITPVPLATYFGAAAALRLQQSTLHCERVTAAVGILPSDIEKAITAVISRSKDVVK